MNNSVFLNFPWLDQLCRYGFFSLCGAILSILIFGPIIWNHALKWKEKDFPSEVKKNKLLKKRLHEKRAELDERENDIIHIMRLFQEFGFQFDEIVYRMKNRELIK